MSGRLDAIAGRLDFELVPEDMRQDAARHGRSEHILCQMLRVALHLGRDRHLHLLDEHVDDLVHVIEARETDGAHGSGGVGQEAEKAEHGAWGLGRSRARPGTGCSSRPFHTASRTDPARG